MAATDIKLIGLEPGCKVVIRDLDDIRGLVSEKEADRLASLRARGEWIYEDNENSAYINISESVGMTKLTKTVHREDVVRVYEEAQQARQKRFQILLEEYPGDAGVPEETDTIERYCCVQRNAQICGEETKHAFIWSDVFGQVADQAGRDIFDGWWPEAVFDLDTGERIDLHIASPVITQSEDQQIMFNVLKPEDRSEWHRQERQRREDEAHA